MASPSLEYYARQIHNYREAIALIESFVADGTVSNLEETLGHLERLRRAHDALIDELDQESLVDLRNMVRSLAAEDDHA